MKRTVRNVLVAVATLTVVTAGPVAAEPAAPAAPVTVLAQQQDDDRDSGHEDDDDGGLWGLLGLLGLVGLVGLIRRGRADDRLAGPAAAPPATESELLDRRQVRPRTSQQVADPAQPPREGGFRQS